MGGGASRGGRPLIIGHRGASADAPENTLAAFDLAFADGADGVEFDVRLAADGVPVVIHDATLERTALARARVEALTSRELSRVGAGEWFNLRHPARARAPYASERVPTLAQVFGRFGARTLYVELKCEEPARRAPLARAVVELIRAHGLSRSVVVKSFEHDSLREVKRLAPEVRTAALFKPCLRRPLLPAPVIVAEADACGADEISLHRSLVRAATVERARRRGFEVLAWTVNAPGSLRRARAVGLRAVFTDHPGRMRRALEGLGADDAAKGETA
ncbi:MAG TPA: glycerophosphodiester phosphodiesterase [Pyrinomonadaceae bacterium]|jgi:glycerophosphoryl diester phosphodiesterase